MITIEKTEVRGFEPAIRGLRNPLNSWDRSDSHTQIGIGTDDFFLGEADENLCQRMNASTEQSKYRRMIVVYADITAPLYWWKEYDTYKVGTVANSCSTMHKIHSRDLAADDFSIESLIDGSDENDADALGVEVQDFDGYLSNITARHLMSITIDVINAYRQKYVETKDKKYWNQLIQLLPASYNQKRTVMLNYEVLAQMYRQRKNHKLAEWHTFCDWVKTLPYSQIITGEDNETK